MARVASRQMKVGAFWFSPAGTLLTKVRSFTQCPVNKDVLLCRLEQLGHSIDADMSALAAE
jgi:hypothetical protein